MRFLARLSQSLCTACSPVMRSLVGLCLSIASLLVPAGGQLTTVYAATQYTVRVGGESIDKSAQALGFYPAVITIVEGDSITWQQTTEEPHSVTFFGSMQDLPTFTIPAPGGGIAINPAWFNPNGATSFAGTGLAHSGFMPAVGTSFTLTFPRAGTYQHICLVHGPGQRGVVRVLPAGQRAPMTPAEVDAQGAAEQSAGVAIADMLGRGISDRQTPAANGRTVHHIRADVPVPQGNMAVLRFLPGSLTVRVGDTVRWDMSGNPAAFHTITFLSGAPVPDFLIPQPQQSGPPLLLINPQVLQPAGGAIYEGRGMVNSGLLFSPIPDPREAIVSQGLSFQVAFTRPGTYEYICVVHAAQGMRGTITVVE
jgi:plastocyanin